MSQKNFPKGSSRRGGYRENAGRKPIWVHQETCTNFEIEVIRGLSQSIPLISFEFFKN